MSRPGFCFLVCPDAALVKQRIAALLEQHPPDGNGGGMLGAAGPQAFERKVFWGDEGLGEAFWQALTLTDLFGRPKALIIRNAQNLDKEDKEVWKKLAGPLSRHNAQAWPFFCLENEFERGKPKIPAALTKSKFWKFAQEKGWVWQSPGLGSKGLRAWLADWAKNKGFSFAPGALEALVGSMPTDATAIACELEKLELALEPGARIAPEMAGLLSHVPDMDIFTFIDALQNNRAPGMVWQKVLAHQLAGKGFLFQFLAMLVREARIMWQLAHQEQGVRLPPSVLQAKQRTAQELGAQRIARIWDLALEAELRVKTGEAGEEQALEMLIADFSRLFSARPSGGGTAARRRPLESAPGGR